MPINAGEQFKSQKDPSCCCEILQYVGEEFWKYLSGKDEPFTVRASKLAARVVLFLTIISSIILFITFPFLLFDDYRTSTDVNVEKPFKLPDIYLCFPLGPNWVSGNVSVTSVDYLTLGIDLNDLEYRILNIPNFGYQHNCIVLNETLSKTVAPDNLVDSSGFLVFRIWRTRLEAVYNQAVEEGKALGVHLIITSEPINSDDVVDIRQSDIAYLPIRGLSVVNMRLEKFLDKKGEIYERYWPTESNFIPLIGGSQCIGDVCTDKATITIHLQTMSVLTVSTESETQHYLRIFSYAGGFRDIVATFLLVLLIAFPYACSCCSRCVNPREETELPGSDTEMREKISTENPNSTKCSEKLKSWLRKFKDFENEDNRTVTYEFYEKARSFNNLMKQTS